MKSSATANPILSGIYNQHMRDPSGFIGLALMPVFSTAMQSADYYVFLKENVLLVPTVKKRAPGTNYPRVLSKVSDDHFNCSDYGQEAPVPDEDRDKYKSYFDADAAAMKRIADIIKVGHEMRVHTLAGSAAVPKAAVAAAWNVEASNPRDDVNAAKEAIRLGIGLRANTMVISETVKQILEVHPKILEAYKYTQGGVLTEQLLAAYFGINRILVAGTVQATNQEGQAITAADIWGDEVLLAHVETGQDLSLPNFGRTFSWTASGRSVEGTIETYRDEAIKSDVHRCEHFTDEKLTSPEAGYLLTGIIT